MKNKEYTSKDIELLSERDHVRLRTAVALGNMESTEYVFPSFLNNSFELKTFTFIPAVFKAIGEIIDNSIDEFAHIKIPNKKLQIEYADNMYTITDNGRGVPIDKHVSGKFAPEVVFAQLRSSRNFKNDKVAGVNGMNGVGSSSVNYCSTEFNVNIQRDGKRYKQTFSDGCLKIGKPSIVTTGSPKTGTSVSLKLDEKIFKDVNLPDGLMHNRAIVTALVNPGTEVSYNDHKYKFKKGFDDVLPNISSKYFKFENDTMEFYVIFDFNKSVDEQIFTWVNSSLLLDGGICNTQFLNAFVETTIEHLIKDAKKNKIEITRNDVRRNLLIFGNLKISDPQYDSQAKTRLSGPNLKNKFVELVQNQWSVFARRNKEWLTGVLEFAMRRYNSNADSKALKDLQKVSNKKVAGLLDATGTNIFERQLLITEGISAKAQISEARDPVTTAAYPLTGKINNVYGATVAQILNMGKITDLLTVIGLIPGQKAIRSSLKYGKIIIATDADPDGANIMGLVVNILFQFWPELFDNQYSPIVYRLIAPNVCLVKGNKRIHFPNRHEYEKVKSQYTGYTVNYYKGLGSMHKDDWEMILSGKTNTLIPLVDDGKLGEILKLVFGPDADQRKEWLQQ